MRKEDFSFDLPKDLIAYYPADKRSDSKLLVCNQGHYQHRIFCDILDYINPGDLLVLNDTKVIPARLYGSKPTGGKVELLVERIQENNQCLCHIKASKTPKPGLKISLGNNYEFEVLDRQGELYLCQSNCELMTVLEAVGHIPLPPYIERADSQKDIDRYQTVYAKYDGSVAAPTAGLHFDEALLRKLQQKGVACEYVTLHVGAGTFQSMRVSDVKEHVMHSERAEVSQELCERIKQTKRNGNKVIAVGTTSVRSLETAALKGEIQAFSGETDIFIYPGFEFKVVDAMITNFHLPESTLIMLVAAFIGHETAMQLYQTAIEHQYRFYSYGDATFLIK